MAKAQESFTTILENQNQLADNLSKNAKEFAESFQNNEKVLEKSRSLFQEYADRSKVIAEEVLNADKPEVILEKMPEAYNKVADLNMDFYNKSLELYKELSEQYGAGAYQDFFQNANKMYQKNIEVIMETTQANARVMQSFFK